MLTVVQYEEQLARAQDVGEVVYEGPSGRLLEAEGLGEHRRRQRCVARRGQIHEGDPVSEARRDHASHLHGQARLARPADAGQRDQPRPVVYQPQDQRDLAFAAHEGRQGLRETGGALMGRRR